jgi:lantibiotic modifying enzyme
MPASEVYRDVGEAAWSWVLAQVGDEHGPWLPETVPSGSPPQVPGADRDSLYAGIAGLAPVLAEVAQSRPLTEQERTLSAAIVSRLSAVAASRAEPSLYFGLAGDATALKLLSPGTEGVAMRRLAELMTPAGWNTTEELEPGSHAPLTDLVLGTAGVVLAAVWTGGEYALTLARTGGEALLGVAEVTAGGLDWRLHPRYPKSSPNFSHGTAGVATALALAGLVLGREDFVAAARQGAQHLLSVGDLDNDGFEIPHTIPPSSRVVEPVTYSWCHGPTGTSQLFPALALAGVPEVGGIAVGELRRRCLNSVLAAGVPRRLRPGFWDNDGRCCGTAGVGDVLLDFAQDASSGSDGGWLLESAWGMGDALVDRAIRDDDGVRWQFVEHRSEPSVLPPGTSWMQGAAGIAAFLLRLARVTADGLEAPVVDRPDQWWAVPARLRLSHPSLGTRPEPACPHLHPLA